MKTNFRWNNSTENIYIKATLLCFAFILGATNVILSVGGNIPPDVDPFSKITVKSQSALFRTVGGSATQNKKKSKTFYLEYKDNVVVTFADETEVHADYLEIFVKTKKTEEKSGDSGDVEKVVFKKNVCLMRKNRIVYADKVELIIPKKLCTLDGHVKIEQKKEKLKDVPLVTECEHAQFKWDDEEIALTGTKRKPVSTTIKLDGNLRLYKKKDKKDK